MKKTVVAVLCLVLGLLAGCANQSALLVNLKENESKIQSTGHGFLAIKTNVVANGGDPVGLLLDNERDEHHYVALNPELANSVGVFFGPVVLAEKRIDKERQNYDFLLYQLPVGSYRTTYIMVKHGGSNFPKKLQEETITIEAEKTKYAGSFQITSDMAWVVTNVFKIEKIAEGPADMPTRLTIPRVGEVEVVANLLDLALAP